MDRFPPAFREGEEATAQTAPGYPIFPRFSPSLMQKLGAEAIGTFALVFIGCGAVVVDHTSNGALTHGGVSACFGLVVMTMIYATGHISGAHFNPAVTFAFAAVHRFPWNLVPFYIASQVSAALLASLSLRLIFHPIAHLGATLPAGSPWQALVLEFFLTAFLMFVISSVATDSRSVGTMAGAAIGGVVAMEALMGGPISGASMNPARSIGPAIVSLEFHHLWVYILGPFAGALAGACSYSLIRCHPNNAPIEHGCCQ